MSWFQKQGQLMAMRAKDFPGKKIQNTVTNLVDGTEPQEARLSDIPSTVPEPLKCPWHHTAEKKKKDISY